MKRRRCVAFDIRIWNPRVFFVPKPSFWISHWILLTWFSRRIMCRRFDRAYFSEQFIHFLSTSAHHTIPCERIAGLVHGHLLVMGDNISICPQPLYRATLHLHYTRDPETDQLMMRSWHERKVQDKDRILGRFISLVQKFQEQKIQLWRQ